MRNRLPEPGRNPKMIVKARMGSPNFQDVVLDHPCTPMGLLMKFPSASDHTHTKMVGSVTNSKGEPVKTPPEGLFHYRLEEGDIVDFVNRPPQTKPTT